MSSLVHPEGGRIGAIAGEPARFAHVIRHLYREAERWDLVILELPPEPRARAARAGCTPKELSVERPSCYGAPSSCRSLVLADHDRFFAPAYLEAVAKAVEQSRWGRWTADPRVQDAFVGDNGVFVVVVARRDGRRVVSAYRPIPQGIRPSTATADDFFREAVRKLRDKTSYQDGEPR